MTYPQAPGPDLPPLQQDRIRSLRDVIQAERARGRFAGRRAIPAALPCIG
jgi:hypothetical protein